MITGPPGAGKSTVAELVADRFEAAVLLPADEFWHYIRRGRVAPWLPEADRQNGLVIDVLGTVAAAYASGGYQVVVEGVVGPWFLDRFLAVLRPGRIPVHYAVLRPGEAVAVARATSRDGGAALTDLGPIRHMYREFSRLGRYENCVIDSSAQSPGDTAQEIVAAVRNGRLAVPPAG